MKARNLIVVLVLVALLPSFMYAGGTQETQKVEAPEKAPVVINYYEWDMPNSQFIADFEKENPGIKVEVHIIPANGERATKLDILAMSGSDMDVMPIADGDQFLRFDNGMLANLDAFIKRDSFDMNYAFGPYAEWGKAGNGSYYGIPYRMTKTMVFYNKNMFTEAGIPYPTDEWTYDEYIEIAKKMATWGKNKNIYGTYTHTYANEWATIAGQVGTWFTPQGLSNIKDPAWVKALQTRRMLDEQGIQMSYSQIKAAKAVINSSFLGGKNAMVTAGSWLVRDMKNKEKFPFDFEVGIAFMPRYDESVQGLRSNFSVSILGIPEKSKHKEEAWKFIKYYVEKASAAIAATGNMPTYLPSYDDPQVIHEFQQNSGLAGAYISKLFSKETQFSTNKILGAKGAKYMQIINEESSLYFTGEKALDIVLNTIENRVNAEVLGK